ncbi:hypothetical protein D3C72_1980570 [compost metagenome]
MLIMGARMRTPATCVSNSRSSSPAKCETSVDVPPISKPIILSNPASCAVRTMPTMPPAGPERIASFPWKFDASVSPPLDCMKSRRTPSIREATCST